MSDGKKQDEEKYRLLAEHSQDGMFLATGYKLVYANNALLRILGAHSFEELKEKNMLTLLEKEDAQRIKKDVRKALKGELLERVYEVKATRLDGVPIFISLSMKKVEYAGKPHALGVVRDITARKKTEENLRKSEELFRSVVEHSHGGVLIVDDAHRFVYANDEFCRLLGYSPEELIGRDFREFLDEESREFVADRYLRRQRGEEIPSRYEFTVVAKNGEKRHVEISSATITDSEGNVRTVAQLLDITERKRAEKMQSSAYKISEAVHSTQDFKELLRSIHHIIDELMPAKNFFIALYDEDTETFSLPYFVDEYDTSVDPSNLRYGMTGHVLQTGHSILADKKKIFELREKEGIKRIGHDAVCWLGVPLKIRDATIGVLAVQSYTEGMSYTERDREMLEFVSRQVALAIERKRAEEALRESEEKYRMLVETTEEGISIDDENETIVFANEALARLLGYEKEELLGKRSFDIVYEEDLEKLKKEVGKRRKGKTSKYELRCVTKNGRIKTFLVSATPLYKEGKFIGSLSLMLDITERKTAEEELRKQKSYFQALFEGSPEAIVSMDEKHRVLDVNPAFTRLFGYTADDLKGKDLDDFVLGEDDRMGRMYTSKVINGEIVTAEGKRRRKDGSYVDVSILGAPIFIEGKQVGIFTIYRDITEKLKAEQEKEFYNSLLRHDIANKITVIHGNLELLKEEGLEEAQELFVNDALKAAQSSSELIDTIRKLRRIDTEQTMGALKLDDIISKVIRTLEHQAKNRGITIDYVPIKGVIRANSLIENVFTNIIHNAIIHSHCTTIRIRGMREGKQYKIIIEDDGEGIPQELKDILFEPRVKGKQSAGSGLGLYLVKKLVESYGGNIEVETKKKPMHGTIFHIYLPKFL